MFFRIDPDSAEPIFEQIAGCVRLAALAGELTPGEKLPPARQLADSLIVNVHTVLRAYQDLRDEGLIELRRGRGATVTEHVSGYRTLEAQLEAVLAEAESRGISPRALAALIRDAGQ